MGQTFSRSRRVTLVRYAGRASVCAGQRVVMRGGAEGIRTPDLLVANETRYQLRHSPSRIPAMRDETLAASGPPPESHRHRPQVSGWDSLPKVRMSSMRCRARSAYPCHIRPITLMVRRAGGVSGSISQAHVMRAPPPSAVTVQRTLHGAHERARWTRELVQHIAEAVRPVERSHGFPQGLAVSQDDRAGLTNLAPDLGLVAHLANRRKGGVPVHEDRRQRHRDQLIEGTLRVGPD